MGCTQSKKKSKRAVSTSKEAYIQHNGEGETLAVDLDVDFEKQFERVEWQLKILKEVLLANGSQERAELLKGQTHVELFTLLQSFADKVKTETAADLNVLHEQKSKNATEEHERKLEELQKSHVQEKSSLIETFQAEKNLLKGRITELTADLQAYNELRRRVEESTFKKDLERNIQAHGSPGAFWESEQESLLFVIEMKSKQIQDQSSKLLGLQAVVEKNLSLEDQIIHALQQKEDLSVRIDSYRSLIQQLTNDQQDMQRALDLQKSASLKLNQEKEQLMFKLRHKDSCPTIHLPAIVPEIAPR